MRATARPRAGGLLAVIVALVPIGVGHDGLPAHFVEGDLLRAVARGGGDGDGGDHAIRDMPPPIRAPACRPWSRRVTESSRWMPSESISIFCSAHHVADGDHGERHGVGAAGGGIDGRRAGGAAASAQHVGADDEVAVGVERLAGADHVVPPAGLAGFVADAGGVRVARESVQHQDGVGFGGVQFAISFVGDFDWRQRGAAIERDGIEPDSIGLNDHPRRFS